MQQSQMYPMPYPSGGHQQQPLFIIIPSASGRPSKPHIVPASHYASRSYTDPVHYPQNLLLRRSFIRNKPTKHSQKTHSKRFQDKLKQQIGFAGSQRFTGSPSELVVLSERASELSPVSSKLRDSSKRQIPWTYDDFPEASIQPGGLPTND